MSQRVVPLASSISMQTKWLYANEVNAVKNEKICKWTCVQKQVKVEKHKNGICAFGNAPRYLQGLDNARKIRINVKNGLRKRSVDIVMSKRVT